MSLCIVRFAVSLFVCCCALGMVSFFLLAHVQWEEKGAKRKESVLQKTDFVVDQVSDWLVGGRDVMLRMRNTFARVKPVNGVCSWSGLDMSIGMHELAGSERVMSISIVYYNDSCVYVSRSTSNILSGSRWNSSSYSQSSGVDGAMTPCSRYFSQAILMERDVTSEVFLDEAGESVVLWSGLISCGSQKSGRIFMSTSLRGLQRQVSMSSSDRVVVTSSSFVIVDSQAPWDTISNKSNLSRSVPKKSHNRHLTHEGEAVACSIAATLTGYSWFREVMQNNWDLFDAYNSALGRMAKDSIFSYVVLDNYWKRNPSVVRQMKCEGEPYLIGSASVFVPLFSDIDWIVTVFVPEKVDLSTAEILWFSTTITTFALLFCVGCVALAGGRSLRLSLAEIVKNARERRISRCRPISSARVDPRMYLWGNRKMRCAIDVTVIAADGYSSSQGTVAAKIRCTRSPSQTHPAEETATALFTATNANANVTIEQRGVNEFEGGRARRFASSASEGSFVLNLDTDSGRRHRSFHEYRHRHRHLPRDSNSNNNTTYHRTDNGSNRRQHEQYRRIKKKKDRRGVFYHQQQKQNQECEKGFYCWRDFQPHKRPQRLTVDALEQHQSLLNDIINIKKKKRSERRAQTAEGPREEWAHNKERGEAGGSHGEVGIGTDAFADGAGAAALPGGSSHYLLINKNDNNGFGDKEGAITERVIKKQKEMMRRRGEHKQTEEEGSDEPGHGCRALLHRFFFWIYRLFSSCHFYCTRPPKEVRTIRKEFQVLTNEIDFLLNYYSYYYYYSSSSRGRPPLFHHYDHQRRPIRKFNHNNTATTNNNDNSDRCAPAAVRGACPPPPPRVGRRAARHNNNNKAYSSCCDGEEMMLCYMDEQVAWYWNGEAEEEEEEEKEHNNNLPSALRRPSSAHHDNTTNTNNNSLGLLNPFNGGEERKDEEISDEEEEEHDGGRQRSYRKGAGVGGRQRATCFRPAAREGQTMSIEQNREEEGKEMERRSTVKDVNPSAVIEIRENERCSAQSDDEQHQQQGIEKETEGLSSALDLASSRAADHHHSFCYTHQHATATATATAAETLVPADRDNSSYPSQPPSTIAAATVETNAAMNASRVAGARVGGAVDATLRIMASPNTNNNNNNNNHHPHPHHPHHPHPHPHLSTMAISHPLRTIQQRQHEGGMIPTTHSLSAMNIGGLGGGGGREAHLVRPLSQLY